MKRMGIGLLAAVTLLGAAERAPAATASGTLITNVACATFSALGVGFSVSYCTTATVLIQNPCVALQKLANPTVQASGGTVTFTVYVVNCSPTVSAFSVTVTDRLPDNTTYSGNYLGVVWPAASGTWFPAYSSDNLNWTNGQPAIGQGAPYYLRWQDSVLSMNGSAMVTYTVNVN